MNDAGGAGKKRRQKRVLYKGLILMTAIGIAIAACVWGAATLIRSLSTGKLPEPGSVITLPTTGGSSDDSSTTTTSGDPGETTTTDVVKQGRREGVYTFLIVGMDQDSVFTDVIMVALFDTVNNKLNVLSIPRDTYSNVTIRNTYNINLAYPCGGLKALQTEVMYLIGYVPDFFIKVNMDGFKKIIDKVGGVWFDVPEDMNLDDESQDLHIHLQAGEQWLNGDKALQLMRFRDYLTESNDIKRVKVRQDFLKALAARLLEPANIARAAELIGSLTDYVKTDPNFKESNLIAFAEAAIKLTSDDIYFNYIPGCFSKNIFEPYWIPYKNAILEMVNAYFNPLYEDITVLNIVERAENIGK